MQIIQHTEHLPVPEHAGTGLCSTINRSNFAVDSRLKLHNLFAMQIIQHTGHLPVPEDASTGLCSTMIAATLLWMEDTNCTICLAMQIIQHAGHLPGSEDADSIKAQPSPRVQRQTSDLSALRPKRQDRPQQLQGNVEGILTLQLSHLNVVHTFRAVTIPAQVCHAVTSPCVRKDKKRKGEKDQKRKEGKIEENKGKKRREKKRKEKTRIEQKGKEEENYTFWHQLDGKRSIIPGSPDHHMHFFAPALAVKTL